VDLKDATLMFLVEAAGYPAVSEIAQSAYDRLVEGEEVDYRVLSDLVGEASGKGVLDALRQKYDPAAFEAIVMPILQEAGRRSGRVDKHGSLARTAEPPGEAASHKTRCA
jgi:hypothetical protein